MTSVPAASDKLDSSWERWLLSRENAKIIDKSCQEKLFKSFNASIPKESIENKLKEYDELTFLFRQSVGQHKVGIFHHLLCVGGNLIVDKKDFAFIEGVEEGATCITSPDFEVLCDLPLATAEATPTATNLLNVSSVDDVNALVVGTTTYKPRNFVPIPPFMLESMNKSIAESNGDTKRVLVDAARVIKDFDTLHASDDGFEKAKSKSKDILFWLYSVIADKVGKTPTIGCTNKLLLSKFNELNSRTFGNQNSKNNVDLSKNLDLMLKRPLEVLASSSSATQDYLQKLTQIQAQLNDKVTKSFKKVASKYQNMLCVAASQGDVVPTSLGPDAMEFFSQSSVLNAQIYLNSWLESERIECQVSSALATSLMHGSFLWASSITPSGLASSVITSLDTIRGDTLYEGIVLDYSTKHEMSASSLEKLMKTQILFPSDIESSI